MSLISGLFFGILIVSPVSTKTAQAGRVSSDVFGGGNFFTDDILGIDPVSSNNSNSNNNYDYNYGSSNHGNTGCGSRTCSPCNTCHPAPTPAPTLTGSCSANPSSVDAGDSITWTSVVSGGTGSYSYSWSGTDSLYGNYSSVSKNYPNSGTKNATVTIVSGSQTITRNCSAVVNQVVRNDLVVSCDTNQSTVDIDDSVTWRADASGGNGSYSYSWSGTDGLSGNSANNSWSYDNAGTKRGTVTVTSSDGQTARASCSVYVNQNYSYNNNSNNLSVSCYASPSNPQINSQVNWYANVSGGNGGYSYSWNGTDGLYGSSQSPYIIYNTPGNKSATVTVWSNGRSRSATCYANVGQNSVLAFSQSYQAPLASAVYLSEIPSTGVYDNYKLAFFVGFLALISAWIAYIIVARKKEVEARN